MQSIKKGIGFGVTSGIITTLGLIVGLYSGTHAKFVVIGGILMIAIADAMSDALGMHLSEELSNPITNTKQIWESTISTFVFKFVFALIFILPFLFLELRTAIKICVIFGLAILGIFSYYIAKPIINESGIREILGRLFGYCNVITKLSFYTDDEIYKSMFFFDMSLTELCAKRSDYWELDIEVAKSIKDAAIELVQSILFSARRGFTAINLRTQYTRQVSFDDLVFN